MINNFIFLMALSTENARPTRRGGMGYGTIERTGLISLPQNFLSSRMQFEAEEANTIV